MNPLRFGLVGCGGISNIHGDCLKQLQAEGLAKLIAGAETDPGRRQTWGKKYSVPMHESLESLLTRDDLDVVTVATPSGLHGGMCVRIADSGRHILCEKPLDLRLDRADAALEAARRNHVVLGGMFQQRFPPGPRKVKRAIEQGFFGRIIQVHCETPWYREQGYYDSADWRGTWELDGGVLCNQSPHMIDRLIWLGGDVKEVLSATCQPGMLRDIEAETVAVATVRLENGALGTITGTTLAYDGLPQRVLICGTDGSAAFAGDDLTFFKTRKPFEVDDTAALLAASSPADGKARDPLAMASGAHLANIRDFVMALHENRRPLVSGEDHRKVTRVLNMIYQKANVGPFAHPAA